MCNHGSSIADAVIPEKSQKKCDGVKSKISVLMALPSSPNLWLELNPNL